MSDSVPWQPPGNSIKAQPGGTTNLRLDEVSAGARPRVGVRIRVVRVVRISIGSALGSGLGSALRLGVMVWLTVSVKIRVRVRVRVRVRFRVRVWVRVVCTQVYLFTLDLFGEW